VNLLRNFKLIVLVYYAYIALLLAQMLRWVRQGGRGRLVGMAVIAALALEGACRAGGALELRAVPAAAARGWRKSVTELCAHVKQNTPKDALFHICDPGTKDMPLLFRFLAERSVTVSRKDIWCFWYSRQGRLLEWHQRVHRTAAECARRDTPQAVITAREYGADYLVVPADWDAADLPVAYDEPGGYRVYALRGAGGAHRGAATPAEPRRQPYGIADCQLPIAD
jgi:hypothetical protein